MITLFHSNLSSSVFNSFCRPTQSHASFFTSDVSSCFPSLPLPFSPFFVRAFVRACTCACARLCVCVRAASFFLSLSPKCTMLKCIFSPGWIFRTMNLVCPFDFFAWVLLLVVFCYSLSLSLSRSVIFFFLSRNVILSPAKALSASPSLSVSSSLPLSHLPHLFLFLLSPSSFFFSFPSLSCSLSPSSLFLLSLSLSVLFQVLMAVILSSLQNPLLHDLQEPVPATTCHQVQVLQRLATTKRSRMHIS